MSIANRGRAGFSAGPVGLNYRRRAVLAALVVVGCTTGLSAFAVLSGTLDIPAGRVWVTLTGGGTSLERLVVMDYRLSRLLVALMVGFCLGLAGALTQSITRNPIATPDILGVTGGASAFAVLVVTQPSLTNGLPGGDLVSWTAIAALVGGLVTTALILALSWRGGFDGLRLVLVGIGVNALAAAIVAWLLVRAELESAAVATRWLSGSIEGARMGDAAVLLPASLLCAGIALVLTGHLGALRLGRDVATSLGTPTGRTEAVAVLAAVVAVSIATAIAGPIAFVAFLAPQAAMRLFGTAGPPPIAGGLMGAALMLVADTVSQQLPVVLPVGVVTAVIGAPALLYLLIRYVRRASV